MGTDKMDTGIKRRGTSHLMRGLYFIITTNSLIDEQPLFRQDQRLILL